MLTEKRIVRLNATIQREDENKPKLICERLLPIPDSVQDAQKGLNKNASGMPAGLYLRVESKDCKEYERAVQIIDIFDGNTPLYIFFKDTRQLWHTPRSMYVDINNVMLRELRKRIGDENVSLVENPH